MPSRAEQSVSRSFRTILAALPNGASFANAEQLQDALDGLDFFVPQVLRKKHPEWDRESLDGFFPLMARKCGEREAEIFGLCILITDQTLTPIHLYLQLSPSTDEVSWLECKLGEKGEHGMTRTPWPSSSAIDQLLHALAGRSDRIDWVYKVMFGHRRS